MNNLGLTYKYQGKTDLALQVFQQAITVNPTVPNPYHNIGTIYLDQKKYDQAETYFKKAIQIDPSFGYSYASLIELYQKTGNKEQLKKISEEITKKFK
jgi:tetratricopeptide (TPR) repeat protein